MTTLRQSSKTSRRLAVLTAGVLLAGVAEIARVSDASAAVAATVDCAAASLQTAIDNAAPGTTLTVTGKCLGNYTIDKDLTLNGRGTAVIDARHDGTALTVSSGATVQLTHLNITDGDATGNGLGDNGGAVYNSGILTLSQSEVSGGSGGGIYNDSGAALTLDNTAVSSNRASVFGGGIYNNGALALASSTVSGNDAAYSGGGIFTGFGFDPVTMKDSKITGNTAYSGGGIFNILDNETLMDSTVSGNTATWGAGGIDNNAGTTTLYDSAVTGNTAGAGGSGSYGGGIYTFSGSVWLFDSAVRHNAPDDCSPSGAVVGCDG